MALKASQNPQTLHPKALYTQKASGHVKSPGGLDFASSHVVEHWMQLRYEGVDVQGWAQVVVSLCFSVSPFPSPSLSPRV